MQTPQTNPLLSLSPLDGRYKAKCEELSPFFSEYGLIFYRLRVEIEWLKTLCNCSKMVELSAFKSSDLQSLDSIIDEFSLEDAQRVKDIEKIILPFLYNLSKSDEPYIHWPNRGPIIKAQI